MTDKKCNSAITLFIKFEAIKNCVGQFKSKNKMPVIVLNNAFNSTDLFFNPTVSNYFLKFDFK